MKETGFWLHPGGLLLIFSLFLAACASVSVSLPQTVKSIDSALMQRDLASVLQLVEKPRQYKPKDRLLYYLDAGLLHHYNGNFSRSNELLSLAEEAFEELQTKSLSRGAASMMWNDSSLEYAGEDYEDIYINVFKGLNYIQMQDLAAARVEIRRIDDKLAYLEQKYAKLEKELSQDPNIKTGIKAGKNRFHASALARYLSLLIYYKEGSFDSARIDFDNIGYSFESQAELYPFAIPPILHPSQRGNEPLLNVLCFTNRGPDKVARDLHVRSSKDLLLVGVKADDFSLFSFYWPGIEPDYYFKLSLPKIKARAKRISHVVARTADGRSFRLHKMEDLALTAEHSFEIKEPLILIKSLSRGVLKGLAAQKAKAEAAKRTSSLGATLFSLGADLALFASEKADLRISQYWPAEALIAEIPLPEGEQEITLEYYNSMGHVVYTDKKSVEIQRGALNLVESWSF